MARPGLQLVSRERREPLTDAETLRLGRRLVKLMGVEHVSYPGGGPSVVVQIWGVHEPLPQRAAAMIEEVLGTFDVVEVQD